MNRKQRRAQTHRKGNHNGRVTPKKERAPKLFATVTDDAGNTKQIQIQGEPVSEEEMRAAQFAESQRVIEQSQREEAAMRVRAHVHGLWVPGDPLPGQPQ